MRFTEEYTEKKGTNYLSASIGSQHYNSYSVCVESDGVPGQLQATQYLEIKVLYPFQCSAPSQINLALASAGANVDVYTAALSTSPQGAFYPAVAQLPTIIPARGTLGLARQLAR